jgi:hypothetical protein
MPSLLAILLLIVIPTLVQAETIIVPPPHRGYGVCSKGNVTSFSFSVTAPLPGLTAVYACHKSIYDAWLNADPSGQAILPAPLLDMSCTNPPIVTCTKTLPPNKKLIPEVMCILLKNEESSAAMEVQLEVTWNNDGETTGSSAGTTGVNLGALIGGVVGACFLVGAVLPGAYYTLRARRAKQQAMEQAVVTEPETLHPPSGVFAQDRQSEETASWVADNIEPL